MPDHDFDSKDGAWIKVWHEFLAAIAKVDLSNAEFRVLFCVMRYAWGWGKSSAIIERCKILEYTGLKDAAEWKATKKLQKRNILQTFPQEGKKAKVFKINSKFGTWKNLPPGRLLPPGRFKPSPRKRHLIKKIKKRGVWGEIAPTGEFLKKDRPWLDATAWNDFVAHREDIKHELSELAITKALNFLKKYVDFQSIIVDATIINNWRGLFPPKGGTSKQAAKSLHNRKIDKWRKRYVERYSESETD
jgi:phage replication O-like protein O